MAAEDRADPPPAGGGGRRVAPDGGGPPGRAVPAPVRAARDSPSPAGEGSGATLESGGSSPPDDATDAETALRLLAIDPIGLGGIRLRARAGPARDRYVETLRATLPAGTPIRRVPVHASDDRLLGGLDLAATLRLGRPVAERGLFAAADGGVVLLPMAERCTPGLAARLAAALDTGEVFAERDGFAFRDPARFAVIALDEGLDDQEVPPASLTERLGFQVTLDPRVPSAETPLPVGERSSRRSRPGEGVEPYPESASPLTLPSPPRGEGSRAQPGGSETVTDARARLPEVEADDEVLDALCAAADAFGIGSARAVLFALRAARASAALAGRPRVAAEDAALAARLVLAPRATRMPAPDQHSAPGPTEPDPPPPSDPGEAETDEAVPPDGLDEIVVDALAAAIPADLLARLRLGQAAGAGRGGQAGSGAQQRAKLGGRPVGTTRGDPRRGGRVDLLATLRTAAPWQKLRRPPGETSIAVTRDDLRVRRFKRRVESTAIFVVDASGSAAFHRMAEAKGAVELLLAECYVRRDRVALLAFRGKEADLVLPPTRSLARAKRGLAALPGGGGTPLATAIDATAALAETVTRGGGTAIAVFLSDGRANIGRDGSPGREGAARDAALAARRLRAASVRSLFIDISSRPDAAAAAVASEMGATYLPLPAGNAESVADLVRTELAGRAAARL